MWKEIEISEKQKNIRELSNYFEREKVFMKNQLLKKICTLILTATLIVSQQSSCIFASNVTDTYASIKQSVETPDYDYWMAQTLMYGIDNNGN